MIAKTMEMRLCKCIYLVSDENGILTAKELTVDVPEKLMYKNGAASEYVSNYCNISAESIYRIESLENPRKVQFKMSEVTFIKNAEMKY